MRAQQKQTTRTPKAKAKAKERDNRKEAKDKEPELSTVLYDDGNESREGRRKGSTCSGTQGPGSKEGGKGKGESDDRECHNCGAKGQIARNCLDPKNSGNLRVPAREVGNIEGEELYEVHV